LDTSTDRGKCWPPGGRCHPRRGKRCNSHLRCSNSVPGRSIVPGGAFVPAAKSLLGRVRKVLPHVCTFAPGLHRDFRKSANKDAGQNDDYSPIRCIYREICTDKNSTLHHLHRKRRASRGGNPGPGACEIRGGANILVIPEDRRQIRKMGAIPGNLWCKSGCKQGAKGCKGVTRPAPAARSDPGRISPGGARPRLVRPLRIG
jgi:hypothetical protein